MKLWSALILVGTKVYACTVDTDCNCRYHSTAGTDLFKCAETGTGSEPIPSRGEFFNDDVLQWNENTSCSLTSDPWVCYCDENIPNEAGLGGGTCNYSRFPMPDPPTDNPTTSPTPAPTPQSSMQPSISSAPSLRPSESPSVSDWPTSQPSSSPSMSSVPSIAKRGSISGYVFNDLNRDGFSTDEPGMPGQVIGLYCLRGEAFPVNEAAVTSDDDGRYEFGDVKVGTCYIRVVPSDPNLVFSPMQVGGNRVDQLGTSTQIEVQDQGVYDDLNVGMYMLTEQPTNEPTRLFLRESETSSSPTVDELQTPSPSDDTLQTSTPTDCKEYCPNKVIDPDLGYHDCGWGVWEDCTCQCVCDPGVCLSANSKCYDGCTTHLDFNPYGGCKPGVDCPWFKSKLGEPHCESSANFAGVHALRETAELCCKVHFSYLDQDTCVKDSIADVASEEAKVAQDLARQKYFYPDMYGKQNCVFDSDYEDWMMGENAAHFLSLSHEPCCEKWYPAKDDCPIMNSTTTPKQLDYKPDPSEGYYYPHLDGSNCRFGRNYPMWMDLSPKHYLYTTPEQCCSTWYPDESNCPMVEDDGVQEGHFWVVDEAYYPNFKGNWCAHGNDYPEWMADPTQRETHLFKTAQECCELWFPSKSAECQDNIIESSYGEQISGPPNYNNGTWYPSLDGTYKCLDDTPPPEWMTEEGFQDEYIFRSHAECCKAHFCEDIRGVVQS